ncbi:matrin-3-like protein [Lates japonicus]|uniref:Matrin-3-like protein n=1 Tax=Lates japonicus TaxID=270547 RepID=A0AAD3RJ64_LATJO|nr:matrin-3-like protein [Lates japonicus]
MSRKYPYPSDTDLRPHPGPYSSSDLRHASQNRDFYRPPQESFSSSHPSSSSSSSRSAAQWSQDGALSILSSCGLEPSDLSLLAELPEDVLTVESLPHVLKQIKGKRETVKPFSPNAPSPSSSSSSYPPSSSRRPAGSSGATDWDQLHSQPVQYPLDHITTGPLPSEQVQDRWGNPRTSRSVRADPPSSSSSSSSTYMVGFHHRPGPSEYGKTGRATGPVSSQDRSSFRSAGQGQRAYPPHFSEPGSGSYRSAPPDEYQSKPRGRRSESENSSIRSNQHATAAAPIPSKREAQDFHGTCPQVFPYSCSLCDITVLSERVWVKHINGTQHADGQLSLLQRFPNWDCRMETVSRADNQSEKWKNEEKPTRPPQTANQSSKPQPNTQPQRKGSERSKVVCVKFPAQSVDETYLRKLTEPFGKIVRILMFPSLAFVELGSVDQAKDLVKFHVNYPPTVNGEQIEFSISSTFNFLQSSRVVSFTPAPTGEDGRSDLISIIKRFGPPLYTLFLPSKASVEMKNAPDAQKLVDYYSSNTLRINNDLIQVSFSGEYKSLMRVSAAKRFEEETTKRTRSQSREREKTTETKRRRSSSKDGAEERKDEGGKSSRERRTRQNGSTETTVEPDEPEKPDSTESRTEAEPAPLSDSKPEAGETEQSEAEAESSAEESDIEGMEVIGEDGENLEDEDMETLDDADVEEEEEEEQAAEENNCPAEGSDSPGEEKEKEVKDGETEDQETPVTEQEEEEEGEKVIEETQEEDSETTRETEETAETQPEDDEEESDFPVDLENCITLDELEEDQSDDQEPRDEPESPSTRVVYFSNLPERFYTDTEFVKLVKDYGTAARYFLLRRRQEGFIEMSSSSEALRAAKELSCKSVTFHGSKLLVHISHKYTRLSNGYEVEPDSDPDEERRCSQSSSRRSERRSRSKTSNRDETCRKSEGRKESSKRTPERGSKTSTEKESTDEKSSDNMSISRKTPEKESQDKKTREEDVKNTSEKESVPRKTPEKEPSNKKTPEKELSAKTTSEKLSTDEESVSKKTEEKDSAAKKTPEKELLPKTSPEDKNLKRKDDTVPEKTLKEDGESEKTPTGKEERSAEQTPQTEEAAGKESSSEPAVQDSEKSPDPPTPQIEEKPAGGDDDRLKDSDDVVKLEQKPGPEGGAAEPEKPTKPVGTEFVRPVVGYFCNLCQVIYADEDEAKLQHCSSLTHYRKYQEKTGKDPWAM